MELNFLISVLDRDRADEMTAIYQDHGLPMVVTFLGRGTAQSEVLDLYGLQATEKAVVTAVDAAGFDMVRHRGSLRVTVYDAMIPHGAGAVK